MNCNSKQNINRAMINNEAINEDGFIIDMKKFSQLNTEYTKLSNELYDLDVKSLYTVASDNYAIPNVEVFTAIDHIINKTDPFDNVDFSQDFQINERPQILYEKILQFKQNQISRMKNRLLYYEQEKRDNRTDKEYIKTLVSLEQSTRERLEGTKSTKGVIDEYEELKKSPSLEVLGSYIESDYLRIEELIETKDFNNLKEASVIIDFYKRMSNFDSKDQHPLFLKSEMFRDGKLILPKNIIEGLTETGKLFIEKANEIREIEKKVIMDTLSSDQKFTRTLKDYFSDKDPEDIYKHVFSEEDGMKDIHWVDMFMMDTTNGIFSSNGVIPSVMQNLLKSIYEEKMVYAKKVTKEIDELQPEVEKALRSMGMGIRTLGINAVSYEIFRSVDSNGNYRDGIVNRFSSNFYESKAEMLTEFNRLMSESKLDENSNVRANMQTNAYRLRDNWLRENTIVFDIRKLQAVSELNLDIDEDIQFSIEEFENYKKELTSILGEKGFEEEVQKQIEKIKNYATSYEVMKENLIAEEMVSSYKDLSKISRNKLLYFKNKNSPFTALKRYYDSELIVGDDVIVENNMYYNYSIPRKNKTKFSGVYNDDSKGIYGDNIYVDTNQSTDYYDKNFEIIESNEHLKKFHTLLSDVQSKIYGSLTAEDRGKFYAGSLPTLRRQTLEILMDKNVPVLQRISKAARVWYDNFRYKFGETPQSQLSQALVNPITGIPDYTVNSDFLRSNKSQIESLYKIEETRMLQALNIPEAKRLGRFDKYNILNNDRVISILAENYGVQPTISALKKRLPNVNFEAIELGNILKNGIVHNVVSSTSFDLPKIMKNFVVLTQEYNARKQALPVLELMKQHYEEIKSNSTTKAGKPITNTSTGEKRMEGLRKRANRQMESWFQRAVLGNYSSKSEIGDSTVLRDFNFGMTGNEQIDSLTSKLKTTITGKIYDTDEKIAAKKIDNLLEELEYQIKDSLERFAGETDRNTKLKLQKETEELQKKKQSLLRIKDNMGKEFSVAAFFDAIFNWIRLLGLGWNVSSGATNFLEGQTANLIAAASGYYFTPENIYRASDIVKGSFVKNSTRGLVSTKGARKAAVLMKRYDVLQDASNELQKASAKSAYSTLNALNPYEITQRVEYLNQAPLLIATLMDIKVGEGENETNLWDAMDENGQLLPEYSTEETRKNWEEGNGQDYRDFKSKIIKTIVNVHGDYDEFRGNMASEYILGKALLMFKRWMARQFYQRFAIDQPDLELEVVDFKGRYRSHTKVTGLLHGSLIGFAGLGIFGVGPLGLVLGGSIGMLTGALWGANTRMSFLKELAIVGKEYAMTVLRLPVNMFTGMNLVKSNMSETSEMFLNEMRNEDFSETDLRNLRSNLAEMAILTAFTGLLIMTKAMLWDDDDEDDDTRRMAHNLLANRFMQLSSQSAMYLNPVEGWESTVGTIPLIRFYDNAYKTFKEAEDYLEGHDIIPTGPHAGESALAKQASKTFLPGILRDGTDLTLGFGTHMERQFENHHFDKWFYGDEKLAKMERRSLKLQTKARFIRDTMNDDDKQRIEKSINKFFTKKKGESEVEALERIENEQFTP